MSENVFKQKADARAAKVEGKAEKTAKPERTKLTLSLTVEDRETLEGMANDEGVAMATLVHMMISERKARSDK